MSSSCPICCTIGTKVLLSAWVPIRKTVWWDLLDLDPRHQLLLCVHPSFAKTAPVPCVCMPFQGTAARRCLRLLVLQVGHFDGAVCLLEYFVLRMYVCRAIKRDVWALMHHDSRQDIQLCPSLPLSGPLHEDHGCPLAPMSKPTWSTTIA